MTAPAAKVVANKVASKNTKSHASKTTVTKTNPKGETSTQVTEHESHTTAPKAKGSTSAKAPNVKIPTFGNPQNVKQYRQILAAEFFVGLIVILLTPTTEAAKNKVSVVVQAASFIAAMAILMALTSFGRNMGRLAAALGGLIVLTLLMKMTAAKGNRFGAITSPKETSNA